MNTSKSWIALLTTLIAQGNNVSPRGFGTKEILGHQSRIDMSHPVLMIPERKLNLAFLYGEAWWILSGSNRVSDIKKYMKGIAKYSDNGITFRGAYGPKVVEQLDYICGSLIADHVSRQALMTIWRENPTPSKDIPCTVALQFFIRDNKLHCNATMRSSDAWLGWVYDTFNFSMLSAWIAIYIRNHFASTLKSSPLTQLDLGELILTSGSQHIYDVNHEAARAIVDKYQHFPSSEFDLCAKIDLSRYSHPDQLLSDLEASAEIHRGA